MTTGPVPGRRTRTSTCSSSSSTIATAAAPPTPAPAAIASGVTANCRWKTSSDSFKVSSAVAMLKLARVCSPLKAKAPPAGAPPLKSAAAVPPAT